MKLNEEGPATADNHALYDSLRRSSGRPEGEGKQDMTDVLGMQMAAIEEAAEVMFKRFKQDGSVAYLPKDPNNNLEYSVDLRLQSLTSYEVDRRSLHKIPRTTCYTDVDRGRREILTIVVSDASLMPKKLLRYLPRAKVIRAEHPDEQYSVPAWDALTVTSMGLGLTRGELKATTDSPSERHRIENPFYSTVDGVRIQLRAQWLNGGGREKQEVTGLIVDCVYDFNLRRFVRIGHASAQLSVREDEEVDDVPLIGTRNNPGLFDVIIAEFMPAIRGLNIPFVAPPMPEERPGRLTLSLDGLTDQPTKRR